MTMSKPSDRRFLQSCEEIACPPEALPTCPGLEVSVRFYPHCTACWVTLALGGAHGRTVQSGLLGSGQVLVVLSGVAVRAVCSLFVCVQACPVFTTPATVRAKCWHLASVPSLLHQHKVLAAAVTAELPEQ